MIPVESGPRSRYPRRECAYEGCQTKFWPVRGNNVFCSPRCYNRDGRLRLALPARECAYEGCRVEFVPSSGRHRFCNSGCRRMWRLRQYALIRAMRPPIEGECLVCGTNFVAIRRDRMVFCSQRCGTSKRANKKRAIIRTLHKSGWSVDEMTDRLAIPRFWVSRLVDKYGREEEGDWDE